MSSLSSGLEDAGIFIFDSCRHWIRCVPVLPRDIGNRQEAVKRARSFSAPVFRDPGDLSARCQRI